MSTNSFVEFDRHGRGFAGIFGKGAGRGVRRQPLQSQKKIRDEKHAKKNMPSTIHIAQYVDLDLHGRGDPRVFGNDVLCPDSIKVKRPSDATIYRRAILISPQYLLKNTDLYTPVPLGHLSSSPSKKLGSEEKREKGKKEVEEKKEIEPRKLEPLPISAVREGDAVDNTLNPDLHSVHSPYINSTPKRVKSSKRGAVDLTRIESGHVVHTLRSLQSSHSIFGRSSSRNPSSVQLASTNPTCEVGHQLQTYQAMPAGPSSPPLTVDSPASESHDKLTATGIPGTSTYAISGSKTTSETSSPKSLPAASGPVPTQPSSNLGSPKPTSTLPSSPQTSCSTTSGSAPLVTQKRSLPSASSSNRAQGGVVSQAAVVVSTSSERSGVQSPRAKSFFQNGSGPSGSPPSSAPKSSSTAGTKSPSSSQAIRRPHLSGKGRELFKRSASLLKGLFRKSNSSQTPSTQRGGSLGMHSGRNVGPCEMKNSGDVNTVAFRLAETGEVHGEHKGGKRVESSNDAPCSASSDVYSDFADLAIPDDEWHPNSKEGKSSAAFVVDNGAVREGGTDQVGAHSKKIRDVKDDS